MRRAVFAYWALALVGLGLSGCGLSRLEQREAWRTQAEEACLSQKIVRPSAYMSRLSAIDGPGACGMTSPFAVTAFGEGTIALNRRATLACPLIPRIDQWLAEVVQPAAQLYYGTSVAEVKSGTYSCRGRNNQRGAKLSEHSFGNAMDVMGFVLADGRQVMVVKGWRGEAVDQEFLREAFVGACTIFTTVLGPGSDSFHHDHFHLDLARHDPRGQRRICKPMLKFEPRIGEGGVVAQSPSRPAPAYAEAPMTPRHAPVEAARAPMSRGSRLDVEPDEGGAEGEDGEAGEEEARAPASVRPQVSVSAPIYATPPSAYSSAPLSRSGSLSPAPARSPSGPAPGVPLPPHRNLSASGIY